MNFVDVESNTSRKSVNSQIKKTLAIGVVLTFLILEIYACYSLTHLYEGYLNSTLNTCGRNFSLGDNLEVFVCHNRIKFVQIFKNSTFKSHGEISIVGGELIKLFHLLQT